MLADELPCASCGHRVDFDFTSGAHLAISAALLKLAAGSENELLRSPGRNDRASLHAAFLGASKKVGRNDPCPCGSGKKYKNCCLAKH